MPIHLAERTRQQQSTDSSLADTWAWAPGMVARVGSWNLKHFTDSPSRHVMHDNVVSEIVRSKVRADMRLPAA